MTEMLTVLDVIKKTTEFFASKGIESPRLNAELLVGHALGLPRMQLYVQFERPLAAAELDQIRPLVRRRGQREPVQYIIGETDFHGLKLKVDGRALIPRPETEQLIEIVTGACTAPPATILDLGTGTGAIALALAKAYPAAAVTAVDSSEESLALARENAASTGLADRVVFLPSDWFANIPPATRFDLIVSNPPYLSAEETAKTAPEVKNYEPVGALTAADDGLADLRRILSEASAFMSAGGLLALETGTSHHDTLLRLARERGFATAESRPDLTGRDRFVLVRR